MNQFEAAKTGTLEWFQCQDYNGLLEDLRETDEAGLYPVQYACENQHLHLIKYFFESCSQKITLLSSNQHHAAFRVALYSNSLEILKYFLDDAPVKIRIPIENSDFYVLRWAIGLCRLKITKYLFEECSQRNKITPEIMQDSVIYWAAEHGHLAIMKYLLEECPNRDQIDLSTSDSVILSVVCNGNHLNILKYLVEECPQRCSIDVLDGSREAIATAKFLLHSKILEYLLPIAETAQLLGSEIWSNTCQLLDHLDQSGQLTYSTGLMVLTTLPKTVLSSLSTTLDNSEYLKKYLIHFSEDTQKKQIPTTRHL